MDLVSYDVRDRIAHVTISNGKANALSPDVIAALGAALARAEDAGESEVGAILLTTASPGMFSGGFDLEIMRRVIIPLSKPALAAVGLFNFIYAWNNFYDVLVWVGENPQAQTLSLALSQFKTLHHVEWNLTMAASIIFMLPVIVIFFLAQRVFIEGVSLTGIKG